MRRAVGVENEPRTHVLEAGAIRRFAEAIGDPNPDYRDGSGGPIAPPTFLRSLSSGPPAVAFESPYPDPLDGGSDWEYFHPVRAGDSITVTEVLVDVVEKSGRLGPMLLTTWAFKYSNQRGEVAATQRNTLIYYTAEQPNV